MGYNVKINGNTYVLPVKNMEVMKQLERFSEIPELYGNKKINIEEVVNTQYDFLVKCIGIEAVESFLGTDVELIDLDLLSFAIYDIMDAYSKESIKKQMQVQTAQIKTFMADRDVARAVDALSKAK